MGLKRNGTRQLLFYADNVNLLGDNRGKEKKQELQSTLVRRLV
jgi:hypothetical protein